MTARQAYVYEAELELAPGTDPRAPGGTVTVALCGHWDHEGPCRWPHHSAIDTDTAPARLCTVFACADEEADSVQATIDDAVRAFQPKEVPLSALYETRFGLMRKDLVEWAKDKVEVPVVHIPVRVDDDAVRWDVIHTLIVGTRTIASPELISRLRQLASGKPHRYTIICPKSGDISREQVCERLARTLAELYKSDIDATGQPMSPEPFAAIEIDAVLISLSNDAFGLAHRQSSEGDGVGDVRLCVCRSQRENTARVACGDRSRGDLFLYSKGQLE